MRLQHSFIALVGAGLLSACMGGTVSTPPNVAPPVATNTAPPAPAVPLVERALRDGRVLLSAQPTADDLASLKAAGVDRVINFRAESEMSSLGFDEPALLAADGVAYSALPITGNDAYTTAVLDEFTALMADPNQTVLLHCASGTRAGHLYAAWLVREQGLSPDEAMRRVAPLGLWPLPMERLLDRPLQLRDAASGG
jgi:uncharacterized protein (TIGR01244 family)